MMAMGMGGMISDSVERRGFPTTTKNNTCVETGIRRHGDTELVTEESSVNRGLGLVFLRIYYRSPLFAGVALALKHIAPQAP